MRQTWRERWRREGGAGELLGLAWPFVLSNSLWMLQITLDRVLLSRAGSELVGAAMATSALFWTPITLFQYTAGYATTFVAQYTGAGQARRVGPAVWQALYLAAAGGLLFWLLAPLAGPLIALGGHSPAMQESEASYFRTLCYAASPLLVHAAACSFFSGRGASGTVLAINAAGLLVNIALAYAWIFGRWGFPALGIAGAGWATVLGSTTSACLALGLMALPRYRGTYQTLAGWRFDPDLFRRLLRYGFPNGLLTALDILAFTIFLFLIGRLGEAELSATSITFTLNLIAFFPAMGLAQAVSVLVGQRLGENRPKLAERSTWAGFWLAVTYMTTVGVFYVLRPDLLLEGFRSDVEPERWTRVAELVPVLLRFVAFYCLFDSINLIFSFALRGAGDTRFVTVVALLISWPVLILPTWASWKFGWGLYPAWSAATTYTVLLALVFFLRFRQGKWRSMRVIEMEAVPESDAPPSDLDAAAVNTSAGR